MFVNDPPRRTGLGEGELNITLESMQAGFDRWNSMGMPGYMERYNAPSDAAKLARQLTVVQKLFGYKFGRTESEAQEITNAIADLLSRNQVRDIRDLALRTETRAVTVSTDYGDTVENQQFTGLWDKQRGAFLMRCDWFNAYQVDLDSCQTGFETLRYERPDRYYIDMQAKATNDGFVYFVPRVGRHTSLWQDLSLIGSVLLMAVPGVGTAIGSTIFGSSLVAAYPLATSIATNAILNTALNGGDIESGVKSALTGAAGGAVGSAVGAAADSELIAKIAAAGTTAALNDGDIQAAVQNALIRYGAGAAGDFVGDVVEMATAEPIVPTYDVTFDDAATTQGDSTMDDYTADFGTYGSGDFSFADPLQQFATTADLQIDNFDFGNIETPLASVSDSFVAAQDYSDADFNYSGVIEPAPAPADVISAVDFSDADFDYGGAPPIPAENYSDADFDYGPLWTDNSPTSAPTTSVPPAPTSASYTFAQGVKDATSLALAAIQVSAAYQAANRPPAVRAGAATGQGSNTVTGQADGMVAVRTGTGQLSVQKPPPGVPYATADGGVIVNNGNGTYTYSNSLGSTVTRPYSTRPAPRPGAAPASGDGMKALAIGGVALAALLLAR